MGFLNKKGKNNKEGDEKVAKVPEPKPQEKPQEAVVPEVKVPPVKVLNSFEKEPVCDDAQDGTCSSLVPPPSVTAKKVKMTTTILSEKKSENNYANVDKPFDPAKAGSVFNLASSDRRVLISLTVTAISSTLVLLLIVYNVFFRRKQRRQRTVWKKDSQKILHKVEDLVEQLEEKDVEKDMLEQKLKTLQKQMAADAAQHQKEQAALLQDRQDESQALQANIQSLTAHRKEMEVEMARLSSEINLLVDIQQDYECQLLEQRLQGQKKDVQIEELQHHNTTQEVQIQELQQKITSDSIKAEKIIEDFTSERDDRFSILQQENDAIKTTVMGLLRQTQQKYDADKVLLKKEMQRRDEKISSLQKEVWECNDILKRVQGQTSARKHLSLSVKKMLDEKFAKESIVKTPSTKELNSSTHAAVETILKGEAECAELKELQNLLASPSETNTTPNNEEKKSDWIGIYLVAAKIEVEMLNIMIVQHIYSIIPST